LDVIASVQTLLPESYNYIDNKIGLGQYSNPILKATRYWIEWNSRAKSLADYSYQIEDLASCWPDIYALLGLSTVKPPFDEVEGKLNARKHSSISGETIQSMDPSLYEELCVAAREYGYNL